VLCELACAAAPPPAPAAPASVSAPAATTSAATTPVQVNAQDNKPVEAANAVTVATITVANPIALARRSETVVLRREDIEKAAPGLDFKKAMIADEADKPLLSQILDLNGDGTPDEILFQTDLAASSKKTFKLRVGERHLAAPSDYKAYGRFVRERHDDFAWENDLVAHRMYGPDLETTPKEPLISSGVDTWSKRVSKLVVNEWYMTDDYHQDSGEGADFYAVGKSRGCGGLGIWSNGKLVTSKNFVTSRVLANGPIRLVFELTYAQWEVAKGVRVSETKRVVLDAGSQFNHFESTLTGNAKAGLTAGIGIAKHRDSALQVDAGSASMRAWEPLRGPKGEESGNLGCAVVLSTGSSVAEQHNDLDYLVTTPVPASGKLSYFVGSAWDRAGRVRDAAAWTSEVQGLAARIATPVVVTLTPVK
jgi:hypothetical protein